MLEATSQVSRFHLETLTPNSQDVDIKGVNVSIGDNELLVDARLQLKAGTHYGLIGRNGVGKSTLLRSIATRALIGWPSHIGTCMVEQELQGSDESVLQAVIDSDPTKRQLNREVRDLEDAVAGAADDPQHLVEVVAAIQGGAAKHEAQVADRTAAKRSGRRGLIARNAAIDADSKARATMLAAARQSPEAAAVAAQELLAERYEKLAEADADADEARATEILFGLGFSLSRMASPTSSLSGGWRMRAALAAALFSPSHLLLLDEPTNHLDLEGILWLQEWLLAKRGSVTLVMVSHDRAFLNSIAQELIILKDKRLTYFPGNYDALVQARAEATANATAQLDALARQKKHIEESIATAEKAARQSGDDKRLGMVASRRKKLENRMGMEKTPDGRRFKVSYWAGYHESRRMQVEVEAEEKPVTFKLPPPAVLRYHGPVLQLREAGYTYRGAAAPVLGSVTMDLGPASRIGLLGANGAGKSTLMRIICGEVDPSSGSVERHAALRIGVFSQDHAAALGGGSALAAAAADTPETHLGVSPEGGGQHADASGTADAGAAAGDAEGGPATALSHMTQAHPGLREQEVRDYLAGFGLAGRLPVQPLTSLSGGQRCRLALALALYGGPQLLLLDEPTNHLDLEAVEALATALRQYEGGLVLASHDRRLLGEVCDELYLVEGGKVVRLPDAGAAAVEAHAGQMLARMRKQQRAAARAAAAPPPAAAAGSAGPKATAAKAGAPAAPAARQATTAEEREAREVAEAEAKKKAALAKQRAQAKQVLWSSGMQRGKR